MNVLYHLNLLDLILLLVSLFFIIKGFMKGFFHEISGVISFILSLWVGYMLYIKLGDMLVPYISSQQWAYLIAYVAIFCGVMISFAMITSLISKHLGMIGGGILDWLGGGLIGALKGFILCIVIVIILDYTAPSALLVVHSQLASFILEHSGFLRSVMNQSIL